MTTIYTDSSGRRYEAVLVPWERVEALLGRPHAGTAEDDRVLVVALLAEGAPDWVADVDGWVEEAGWGLVGPRMAAEAGAAL